MAPNVVTPGMPNMDYSYRSSRTRAARGETCSKALPTAENAAKNEEGRVIGFATLPYGNTGMSYGIKAMYAPESTESDPIVQVTSNYGGETTVYNVHINEVNPRRASQLEMFALLAYTDDQKISDGGSFGSYQQMSIYAKNAEMNGYWEGNGSYDAFASEKHDWQQVMITMWEEYANAGIYSQMKNCMNLNSTMERFSIRFVDFDNIVFENRSAETSLKYMGPNVPTEVARAWFEAAAEADANGMGMSDNGMFDHLSSMMTQRVQKWLGGDESGDVLGDSIQSALKAAREALEALEYPLTPDIMRSPEVQEEIKKEKAFYESFIRKLEALQDGGAVSDTAENEGAAKVADASETDTEQPLDYVQMIHEYIENLFVKIQNGDAEPTFAIGSRSFTITEWEELLEKFDSIEEAIRKLMEEEIEKRREAEKNSIKTVQESTGAVQGSTETEEDSAENVQQSTGAAQGSADTEEESTETVQQSTGAVQDSGRTEKSSEDAAIHMITADTVQARFQLQETDGEGNRKEDVYLIAIDQTGIRCSKLGSDTYEWEITFADEKQYENAVAFMDWAHGHMDNFLFSAHENFWNDFLNGDMDVDGFKEFLAGTDNGVPNYGVTVGDSMYIERDKIRWAKYMNHPGARFYTAREMAEMIAAEIEKNTANKTRLDAPYSEVYKKYHPEYNGEAIFCEYPGGPLYTADEIGQLMYERALRFLDPDWSVRRSLGLDD